MPYQVKDLYSTRHAALLQTLKDKDFSSDGSWTSTIAAARAAVVDEGFNVDKYTACESIRKIVADGGKTKATPATTIMTGASSPTNGVVPAPVTKRIAALETLRNLWLLKKSGSHKLWILSLPLSYADWPEADLEGKAGDALSTRLNDRSTRFSEDDRKHLSQATQEGLKWIHKAMIVSGDPAKAKHNATLKRWFADGTTTDEDITKAAGTLNEGLKKMSNTIKSTFLLMTDMPMDRGKATSAKTNAFVFQSEAINVIYVEAAFFSDKDTWKGLKNWTRIVVHELSHRDAKTEDHRYRHNPSGLKPDASTFSHAKALNNADSWAIFCMDCAGEMSKEDYKKVKVT